MGQSDSQRETARADDPLESWLESFLAEQYESGTSLSADSLIASMSHADSTMQLLQQVWHPGTTSETPPASGPGDGSSANAAKSFGRFRIERLLGQGGMGNVFLAFDPILDRRVALKVPHPEFVLSANSRQRFLREAQAAGMMRHPHIVGVYESGVAEGVCYIASEYCEGVTLREWLREQDVVAPNTAAHIVADLAGAVVHSHEKGVIHRDLKPSNIMMEPVATEATKASITAAHQFGVLPRIMDFGLARVSSPDDAAAALTRTGAALGSAEYMAPSKLKALRIQLVWRPTSMHWE